MLPGVCPGCGLRADLDVFCVQADANKALAAALDLPPSLGGLILRYLRLFSPPSKTLALAKTTRLLVELAETLQSAHVTRRGVAHPAPLALWRAALETILNQPPERLPLDSHGYLFQVVFNLAEAATARHERPPTAPTDSPPFQGEVARSAGVVAPTEKPAPTPPPAEFRALLQRLSGRLIVPPTPPTSE